MQTPSNFTTKKKKKTAIWPSTTFYNHLTNEARTTEGMKNPLPFTACVSLRVWLCVLRENNVRGRIWGVWGITWIPQNPAATNQLTKNLKEVTAQGDMIPKRLACFGIPDIQTRERRGEKKHYHHKYLAFFHCKVTYTHSGLAPKTLPSISFFWRKKC